MRWTTNKTSAIMGVWSLGTQVKDHGYNPPSRNKILEYQSEQEFPIIPNPDDVYKHIEDYRQHKSAS